MLVETLAVGPLQVNCHIVACPVTGEAMVIDPGDESQRIIKVLESHHLKVTAIVNTHGHFDHIGGNRALCGATGAPLMIHASDVELLRRAEQSAASYGLKTSSSPEPDRLLEDGDVVEVGTLRFKVLHVPGHSPGGICLHCDGEVFVGDSLFAGSIGRTDLPGGDYDTLINAIRSKLWRLGDDTVVYSGHGPDTTIGRERRTNPFVGESA